MAANSVSPNWVKRILNKFEIPEDLTEVQRSVLLLKKSNKVQRISVLINLPNIIRDYPESQDVLLPKIFADVLSWDEEMQVELGASLAVIIEENLFTKEMYSQFHIFLQEALESWNNAKWDVVWEHYIEHLNDIFETAEERKNVIDGFVKTSLSLWELSQAIPSRWTGARLTAILSNIVDPDFAKKKLVPRIKNLCRDFNWEVRKAITSHVYKVFNLLTPQETEKEGMYEIMTELLDDEENEVKNLAIEAFFQNVHKFPEERIEESWIPLIIDLMKSESADLIPPLLDTAIANSPVLRKHFGGKEYVESKNEEIQQRIIYNSHHFVETLGEAYFFENMYDKYLTFLKSKSDETRVKIAENIHNLVRALGTAGWYKHEIDKKVATLMVDKHKPVQGALLDHLQLIFEILVPKEVSEEEKDDWGDKISAFKSVFLKNFLKMEESVKTNWRYLIRWIDWLYKIMNSMEPSTVLKKFIPIIITHLKKGGKETRNFWIQFLCRTISENTNAGYKRELWDLSASLPYATCSFTRWIYLEFIAELWDHISKKLFWSQFLDAFYLLSKDKWANVIIKFWAVAPKIYRKVSFDDAKNKDRMINIMKSLMDSEKIKPYVKEFVTKGYKEMVGVGLLSTTEKNLRAEEEKKMFDHEKDISAKDKVDIYKDVKIPNGIKGAKYDTKGYTGSKSTPIDSKPAIPKTTSMNKLKKSLKKKKKEPTKAAKPKAKAK